MDFTRGFIVWGIVVVVLAILLFLFWKFFLCTRPRFEERSKEMAWGMGAILAIVATLMFIPIIFSKTDVKMTEVVENLRQDTVDKAMSSFKENESEELIKVIDNILLEKGIIIPEEANELKDLAISTALKFSKNKPFNEVISTFVNLLKIDGTPLLAVSEDEINNIAYNVVLPYAEAAKEQEIQNSSLKLFFSPVLKTTSFAQISGVELEGTAENAAKAVQKVLSKFFIILSSIVCFILTVLIFCIVMNLRQEKEVVNETEKRDHLFEFDRLADAGKKISEDINQHA